MKFSIVIAHYQGCETDEELDRCMQSIYNQTYKDYEIILLHDGELLRPCKYDIKCSPRRLNCWGHNLRNWGIKLATGDYILITNADNLYYPKALEQLASMLSDGTEIGIMACKMMGLNRNPHTQTVWYDKPRDYRKSVTLKGTPKYGAIDCMQLCASRKVWLEYGGWKDFSKCGDGHMYAELCTLYDYKMTTDIIGEHY